MSYSPAHTQHTRALLPPPIHRRRHFLRGGVLSPLVRRRKVCRSRPSPSSIMDGSLWCYLGPASYMRFGVAVWSTEGEDEWAASLISRGFHHFLGNAGEGKENGLKRFRTQKHKTPPSSSFPLHEFVSPFYLLLLPPFLFPLRKRKKTQPTRQVILLPQLRTPLLSLLLRRRRLVRCVLPFFFSPLLPKLRPSGCGRERE